MSLIGMIMLLGLVIKNSILLVDYTNVLRATGLNKRDALLQAGPVRLRPILMTAISTVAGVCSRSHSDLEPVEHRERQWV